MFAQHATGYLSMFGNRHGLGISCGQHMQFEDVELKDAHKCSIGFQVLSLVTWLVVAPALHQLGY